MFLLNYKFRLYPNKEAEGRLSRNIEICRWLYNKLLEVKKQANRDNRRTDKKDLQSLLVSLKKENPMLNEVYSKVLQMVNNQLHYNLKALTGLKKKGKNVGNLRFKGEGHYKTLNFNQSGFRLDYRTRRLHLSKIGDIPIKLHREVGQGKIKGIIIKRETTGRWFALCQIEDSPSPLPYNGKAIGVDVGVKYFLTDSEARQIENPRYYQKTLDKIRCFQKSVCRKKKSSSNRVNAVLRLSKAYKKLTNQRDDFLHKLSRYYIKNYGVIAVENLKIANMVRNRNLAQKILDASWGKFFEMLSYKAERAGRTFLKVDPKYTSQENEVIEDRDFRGSINILNRGLSGLGRPLEPVETRPLQVVPASLVVETGSPTI
nr:transposase [Candidatus Njordarchaeum guaymaensis]